VTDSFNCLLKNSYKHRVVFTLTTHLYIWVALCPRYALLTPWSRVLPEKLTIPHIPPILHILLDSKVYYRVHDSPPLVPSCPLSQSTHTYNIASRPILILPSHLRLGLLHGLFHSDFLTKSLYEFIFSRPIYRRFPPTLTVSVDCYYSIPHSVYELLCGLIRSVVCLTTGP
jgi:hypothetical protein